MAFLPANVLKRGTESVDAKFSALIEPNLFPDQIFQAGLTFTDKYEVDAMGQLFVRKLGKGSVDTGSTLTFTHAQTADSLISIVLNKPFKQSEAIYEAVELARTGGTGVQKFETVVRNVRTAWQKEALDQLIAGATASANTTVLNADPTHANGIKAALIGVRKELRENDANPDVIICSPRAYAMLLTFSGKEFQPAYGDETLRTGSVGKFLGMRVYESTQLEDNGVNGDVEFIMYDHDAYSILTTIVASRIIDAGKDWAGSAAQVHLISGFQVTNEERVIKKVVG